MYPTKNVYALMSNKYLCVFSMYSSMRYYTSCLVRGSEAWSSAGLLTGGASMSNSTGFRLCTVQDGAFSEMKYLMVGKILFQWEWVCQVYRAVTSRIKVDLLFFIINIISPFADITCSHELSPLIYNVLSYTCLFQHYFYA